MSAWQLVHPALVAMPIDSLLSSETQLPQFQGCEGRKATEMLEFASALQICDKRGKSPGGLGASLHRSGFDY
jgi:hypothetical protein